MYELFWFYVIGIYQNLCTMIVNTQIRHIELGSRYYVYVKCYSCFDKVIWIDCVTVCVVQRPDFFPCNCGEKSNLGGKSDTFGETKNNETMFILTLYEHIFRRRDISILGLYYSFSLLLRKHFLKVLTSRLAWTILSN